MSDPPDPDVLFELVSALKEVFGGLADPEGVLRTLLDQGVRRTGAERGVLVQGACARLAARLGSRGALQAGRRPGLDHAFWLGVYCLVVVSGSDNVIKPLVLRGSARIHPLL